MPKASNKEINRIIDANINRTKEGLRVCEEITRFILENKALTASLKGIRHDLNLLCKSIISPQEQFTQRNSLTDIGRDINLNELKRKTYWDIFFANIQRVKESLRVLEEFSKLKDTGTALKIKKARYKIYQIEKKAFFEIQKTR